jgi:hypothetical protein
MARSRRLVSWNRSTGGVAGLLAGDWGATRNPETPLQEADFACEKRGISFCQKWREPAADGSPGISGLRDFVPPKRNPPALGGRGIVMTGAMRLSRTISRRFSGIMAQTPQGGVRDDPAGGDYDSRESSA